MFIMKEKKRKRNGGRKNKKGNREVGKGVKKL